MIKLTLLSLLLMHPILALADLGAFEQRLQELEKSHEKLKQERKYSPKVKGSIQLDSAFYFEDKDVAPAERIVLKDGLTFRRVRLALEGEFNKHLHYYSQIDVADNVLSLKDVWMGLKMGQHLLRLGDMKPPATQEEVMSSSNIGFLERGLGTNALFFGRLTGLDLSGHFDKKISYQAGVYSNGLSSRAAEQRSLFAYGAKLVGVVWQKNKDLIHLGTHYVRGSQFEEVEFKSRALTRVSSKTVFKTQTIANTHQSEILGAEALVLLGSFRGVFEASQAKAIPRSFVGKDAYTFDSQQLTLGYVLTGESRSYSSHSASIGKLMPEHDFTDGGPGALEVFTRYSQLDLNDGANGTQIKGGKGESLSFGGLWILSPGVQTALEYSQTDLEDSSLQADQKIAVVQARVEMKF